MLGISKGKESSKRKMTNVSKKKGSDREGGKKINSDQERFAGGEEKNEGRRGTRVEGAASKMGQEGEERFLRGRPNTLLPEKSC